MNFFHFLVLFSLRKLDHEQTGNFSLRPNTPFDTVAGFLLLPKCYGSSGAHRDTLDVTQSLLKVHAIFNIHEKTLAESLGLQGTPTKSIRQQLADVITQAKADHPPAWECSSQPYGENEEFPHSMETAQPISITRPRYYRICQSDKLKSNNQVL